jgi:hypothetical protein
MARVFKNGVCFMTLALIAVAICPRCDTVYVYARPDIWYIEESGGVVTIHWESMSEVTKITRYKWEVRKAGWSFEFEDRVTRPFDYVDSFNLIPGTGYGYVVYDDIEPSGMAIIKYKGSRTKKEEA